MIKIKIELSMCQTAILLSAIEDRLRDIDSVFAICRQRKYHVPGKGALEHEKSMLQSTQEIIQKAIPVE